MPETADRILVLTAQIASVRSTPEISSAAIVGRDRV